MKQSVGQVTKLLVASTLTLSLEACGSDARPGLHRCYQPEGSNELCVESISHRRSLGDVARGSPGITARIYGKQDGQIVTLTGTTGGPDAPPEWNNQHGHSAEYLERVDFERIIALLRADAVPESLQRHKDFLLDVLGRIGARKCGLLNPSTLSPASTARPALKEGQAGMPHETTLDRTDAAAWRELDATPDDDDDYKSVDARDEKASSKRYFGSFGDTANRGNRPKFGHASDTYREKIDVFAETFLWGIHSGTITTVYRLESEEWKRLSGLGVVQPRRLSERQEHGVPLLVRARCEHPRVVRARRRVRQPLGPGSQGPLLQRRHGAADQQCVRALVG